MAGYGDVEELDDWILGPKAPVECVEEVGPSLAETVRSRCQEVSFPPLSESFVVETLVREGFPEDRARLACRLAGGNLGRARRIVRDEAGLGFRAAALEALETAGRGSAGPLAAAEKLTAAAKEFRTRLAAELHEELSPYMDPRGRPEDAYRGVVRRIQEQHDRRTRTANPAPTQRMKAAAHAWVSSALMAQLEPA